VGKVGTFIKGTVHNNKKKIIIFMSSFTHPQLVPNPYEFLSNAENKRRYFEECSVNGIDFHSRKK